MTCRRARSSVAATILCVLLVAAAGCGPARGTVTGKVTYKEKIISWGTVSLFASDNMQYSGEITADGTYAIPNVPSGAVKICVVSPNPDNVKRGAALGNDRAGNRREPKHLRTPPANWISIPDQYGDLQTTTLTGTVRRDTTIHLEMN